MIRRLGMRRTAYAATLGIIATAGAAVALLTFASAASAWDLGSLPAGYGVSSFQTVCHVATDACVGGEGSTCNHYTITAGSTGRQLAETDCVNPTFQADLNAFVDSTVCAVNPLAGGSACQTSTSTTTTTVAQTTTTTPITTTVAVPPADPTTTTVAVTTPGYTATVTVTVPAVATDLTARVNLIEQRLLVLEARTQALEDQVGLILGEPKNMAPFTNPA